MRLSLTPNYTLCIFSIHLVKEVIVMKTMTDKQVIQKLGGVKMVSKVLGYEYSTVYNWTTRGISAFAKVKHPQHFMPKSLDDIKPLTIEDKS